MKRWRFEIVIGAAVVLLLAGAGLYTLAFADEPDFPSLVESAPDDAIIFRIDLESAFEEAEPVAGDDGWIEFVIPPEHVSAGDPQYVRAALASPERKQVEVHFNGRWPLTDGYPLVLNREGIVMFSQGAPSEGGYRYLRVRFRGDVGSVGTMTFILGRCLGGPYVDIVEEFCAARGA